MGGGSDGALGKHSIQAGEGSNEERADSADDDQLGAERRWRVYDARSDRHGSRVKGIIILFLLVLGTWPSRRRSTCRGEMAATIAVANCRRHGRWLGRGTVARRAQKARCSCRDRPCGPQSARREGLEDPCGTEKGKKALLADRATACDLALTQPHLIKTKNFFDLAHGNLSCGKTYPPLASAGGLAARLSSAARLLVPGS